MFRWCRDAANRRAEPCFNHGQSCAIPIQGRPFESDTAVARFGLGSEDDVIAGIDGFYAMTI